MYLELKPLDALRHTELPQVAAPWYAINWLKQARSGYCRIGGFHNAWEACIQEIDPRRDHWNHQAHGFEHLCAKIEEGGWVVVLDKSWPPLAPAYTQVNGQWQLTQHIAQPRLRQRLESQIQTIQRQQREQETLQSRNQPSSAEVQTVPASGPGNRVASLGPHVGSETYAKSDEKPAGSGTIPANTRQTTPESQKTVDGAITSIKGSSFATTEEGKKVVSKIEELNTSGKIKFESMSPSTRGKWSGSEIVVNANFSGDVDATASELVHEATHALHEDEFPASKTKITIDEEMRTNENQLALYEDQRKGGFRDPELEQRRNDQANGKLRDNVRRRYPGTPEHL